MNRLVLIGNGFDLAHGLKTSYNDFINWYWNLRVQQMSHELTETSKDCLCSFERKDGQNWLTYAFNNFHLVYRNSPYFENKAISDKEIIDSIISDFDIVKTSFSPFFERIRISIETKKWVDIENEYYTLLKDYVLENASETQIEGLNKQLRYIQDRLVEYLKGIDIPDKLLNTSIRQKIYAPFKRTDISIEGNNALIEHIKAGFERDENEWWWIARQYGFNSLSKGFVDDYKKRCKTDQYLLGDEDPPMELMLPNQIMLLNFNYTHTAQMYCKDAQIFSVNQIHGDLNHPSSVIFGYGDELDHDYKSILNKNNNKYLGNIKSIKYLEADNYRRMLSFIESEPYQILIMGHSCGNSDRTLLNTLFEHKNCVSIKPYYYKWGEGEKDDNYIELVQNISRNFTNMKLMRDRVVNKTYCNTI